MDKSEALEFIGIKEPFNEEALLSRYHERVHYFRMLYANAPSKVIERIQQRNLEKLEEVKRLLQEEIAAKQSLLDKKFGVPVAKPEPVLRQDDGEVVGWLVVHTENRKAEAFDLYRGVNFIGRKKRIDAQHCIVIEEDRYISRTHAFIKCKDAGSEILFELYDGDGSKPSANGVFLNGRATRIPVQTLLADNDTIQIGVTKLVLKCKKENRSLSGEIETIMKTGFIQTINIEK
jgi:hypothetical protein